MILSDMDVTARSQSLDISKLQFQKSDLEVMEWCNNHKEMQGMPARWLNDIITGRSATNKKEPSLPQGQQDKEMTTISRYFSLVYSHALNKSIWLPPLYKYKRKPRGKTFKDKLTCLWAIPIQVLKSKNNETQWITP